MPCDKDRPVSLVEMFDLFLTQPGRSWPLLSTLPTPCARAMTRNSTGNDSFIFKFIHQRHCIFPTAYCMSHQNPSGSSTYDYDENDKERDLSLPGMGTKQISNPSRIVGEFEITQLTAAESGWDRVKHMYRMESGVFQDDCLQVLNTLWYRTTLLGFFVSAVIGGWRLDKAEKSLIKSGAIKKGVASQVLTPKQVLTIALKEGLRISVISLSLYHLSQTISAYKNKSSVWEFSLSTAIGFSVLRIPEGLYSFSFAVVRGAVFGAVIGWMVCQGLQSYEVTQEARTMDRMKQRAKELRLEREGS